MLPLELFGRRIVRRAHDGAAQRQRFGAHHAREAEVDELDRSVEQTIDVARLDVAVDDVFVVRVVQRIEHLQQDLDLLLEVELAAAEHRGEILALQVLHRDVDDAVDLAGFVHRDDVGMRKARAGLGLAVQALEVVRPIDVRPDGLDGDGALERRVDGLVDLAHPTDSEQRLDAKPADVLGRATRTCVHGRYPRSVSKVHLCGR